LETPLIMLDFQLIITDMEKKKMVVLEPEKWDTIVDFMKTINIPLMTSPDNVKVVEALRSREIIDVEITKE
jgi:hypothetical protein